LVDYRAGNLPGDLQSQVKAHLAECPPCRARLNATAGRPALRRGACFANSPDKRGQNDFLTTRSDPFFIQSISSWRSSAGSIPAKLRTR
jgi:hypothetical protein